MNILHRPPDFVSVSDIIPDVLLDVRYYSTYNFVGERIDGYEAPLVLLTRQTAAALSQANDDFRRKGLRTVLYDGYRPQQAVDHFVRWAESSSEAMRAIFYPDVEKKDLFTQGFIARRSGHSRGSTIDLTLLDETTGLLLDMGGPFDYFGELSHPDCSAVTPAQHANRMLLRDIMLKWGFKPLSTEWWHFTLKDEPYPDTYFSFPVRSLQTGNGD